MSGPKKPSAAKVKFLGIGHWREKRGTVNWVSCPDCENWFHIEARLTVEAEAGRTYFHCPHCQNQFDFDAAREIILTP